jgi:hypothetical protein
MLLNIEMGLFLHERAYLSEVRNINTEGSISHCLIFSKCVIDSTAVDLFGMLSARYGKLSP